VKKNGELWETGNCGKEQGQWEIMEDFVTARKLWERMRIGETENCRREWKIVGENR
jgi:hypothetical protein